MMSAVDRYLQWDAGFFTGKIIPLAKIIPTLKKIGRRDQLDRIEWYSVMNALFLVILPGIKKLFVANKRTNLQSCMLNYRKYPIVCLIFWSVSYNCTGIYYTVLYNFKSSVRWFLYWLYFICCFLQRSGLWTHYCCEVQQPPHWTYQIILFRTK